jgi:hypothetical protein
MNDNVDKPSRRSIFIHIESKKIKVQHGNDCLSFFIKDDAENITRALLLRKNILEAKYANYCV